MGEEGIKNISNSLMSNSALKNLYLSFFLFLSSFRKLFLLSKTGQNQIGPKEMTHISKMLQINGNLTLLNLSFTNYAFEYFDEFEKTYKFFKKKRQQSFRH